MKKRNKEIAEGMEQPNQENIRMFGEKEDYMYLRILRVDICYIARYGHVRNGHRMLVTYIHREHRSLEIWKHVTTSLFRYETFLLLLS